MRIQVVDGWPPNIAAIRKVFTLRGGEIFAWAPDTIYAPGGQSLTPALMAHESVHFEQQGEDPAGWWARYIGDPEFRLQQEAEAHRAEWHAYRRNAPARKRRKYLLAIAARMASPLYGGLVTPQGALRLILDE